MEEKRTKNSKIGSAAANLFPGYFALVMATGIISIAAHLLEMQAKAINFHSLLVIPRCFVYVALAAWLATFVGLIHSLLFSRSRN